MSRIYPSALCVASLILTASSAFAMNGPAAPAPVPPPAVALMNGPAAPAPVPPPAVALMHGPAAPAPVPPPAIA